MKVLMTPNDWSCLLTCYAMVMDRSIDELIYKLRHDGSAIIDGKMEGFSTAELDFLSTTLGWAPVHLPSNLPRTDFKTILNYSWPNKTILSYNTGDIWLGAVAFDPTTEYFHDPKQGIRPFQELPPVDYVTTFYWYREYFEE